MAVEVMTLARVLRYKKRLIETIRHLEAEIRQFNSVMVTVERDIDVRQALQNRQTLVKHLVDLKLQIQMANKGIDRQILELAETKAEITFLSQIGTAHGVQEDRFYGANENMPKYTAEIRRAEQQKMVHDLEDKIDLLQSQIDAYNAGTQIEVEIPDVASVWVAE